MTTDTLLETHTRSVSGNHSPSYISRVQSALTNLRLRQFRNFEELDIDKLEQLRAKHLHVQTRNIEAAQVRLRDAGYQVTISDSTIVMNDALAIDHPDEIARLLVSAHVPPTHLAVEQEDLEEHFLHLIGGVQ